MIGDPYGFVDEALAEQAIARRVALTVPDFAMGLATVAESDLIAAMPRRFVAMHAARFGVVSKEVPLRLRTFSIRAAVPKVALMDAGLAWLLDVLREAFEGERGARDKPRAKVRAAR
jgi:DNA-binding transcriptional LysR family regulator